MYLGDIVVALFSVIFLYYTNSFLIKRPQKRAGPLQHPGPGKAPHRQSALLGAVLSGLISIGLGLGLGRCWTGFMYLLLLNLLHFDVSMTYTFLPRVAILTEVARCRRLCAVAALQLGFRWAGPSPLSCSGGQVGRKGAPGQMAPGGHRCVPLRAGYLAVTTESVVAALGVFFLAVILVIIGTYCLFLAGSIAVLKLMKRNKGYYYKPLALRQRLRHALPDEAERRGAGQHLHPVHHGAGHRVHHRQPLRRRQRHSGAPVSLRPETHFLQRRRAGEGLCPHRAGTGAQEAGLEIEELVDYEPSP